jgi:hypothetical protein
VFFNLISYINIERERGYWIISALDEDEDGYDEQNIQYKKQYFYFLFYKIFK